MFARFHFTVFFSAAVASGVAMPALGQYSWDGDCGVNWHDCCNIGSQQNPLWINNWTVDPSPSRCPPVPGPADQATVSNVVDSQPYIISIAGLNQSGLFLCRAQFLTINGGDISMFGSITEPSTMQLIDGSIINLLDGATINIGSFCTFDARGGVIRQFGTPGQVISNYGTLTKTANPELTPSINVPFDNHGLISAQVGTLYFSASSTNANGGVIEALQDAMVVLHGGNGENHYTVDGEVRGDGLIWFTAGYIGSSSSIIGHYHPKNTLLSGAYHVVNFDVDTSLESLTIDNGGVLGGSGDLTVDDLKCYGSPANILPGPPIVVQGTALFKGLYDNGTIGVQRDMELYGDSTIDINTNLNLSQAELRNYGNLEIRSGANITQYCCPNNSGVRNYGLIRKTSGGLSDISVGVSNDGGVIEVESGTLRLDAQMATTGPITVAAGATLWLGDGQQSLFPQGSITGDGTVKVAISYYEPIVDYVEGSIDIGTAEIAFGTIQFEASAVSRILLMTGGALTGSAIFTATEHLNWTAGTMMGSGMTSVSGPVVMLGNGYLQRVLEIDNSQARAGRDRDAGAPAPGTLTLPAWDASGVLRGNGTLDGSLNNAGVVSPGFPGNPSIGAITITGNFAQNAFPAGELTINLAGSTNDRLIIGGIATLAGSLCVSGTPNDGAAYTILTAQSVRGAFTQLNLPGGMTVTYTATEVILQAASGTPCAADIAPRPNGDGIVNIDDLLFVISHWGACPNTGECPADIAPSPADGVVNIDDLLAVINAWGSCP